jgi:hypothetical protein
MHGVCDYSAIHVGKLQGGPGGTIDQPLSFTLGSNAVLNVHSILTFTVKADGGPADIQITINELEVANYKLSDYFGTINKVIGGNVLRHGTNRMRFNVIGEDFVFIYIEDVALWWFKNSLE